MSFLSGHSYGHHTGSLAYPNRNRCRRVFNNELLALMLELIHIDNLGALPPSPFVLAYKAEQMGVAKYSEFFKEIWY